MTEEEHLIIEKLTKQIEIYNKIEVNKLKETQKQNEKLNEIADNTCRAFRNVCEDIHLIIMLKFASIIVIIILVGLVWINWFK